MLQIRFTTLFASPWDYKQGGASMVCISSLAGERGSTVSNITYRTPWLAYLPDKLPGQFHYTNFKL